MARQFTATTDSCAYGTLAFPTVLTMGCWWKGATVDATPRWVIHFSTNNWRLKGNSTQDLEFRREYATLEGVWGLTAANHGVDFNDGKWHSVIYSHNGAAAPGAASDMSVWVDGVNKSSAITLDQAPSGALSAGPWYFVVGNNAHDAGANQPLGGSVAYPWYAGVAATDEMATYFHQNINSPPTAPTQMWNLDGAASPEPNWVDATKPQTVTGTTAVPGPGVSRSLSAVVSGSFDFPERQRTTMPMMRGPRGDRIIRMQQGWSGMGGRRVVNPEPGTQVRLNQPALSWPSFLVDRFRALRSLLAR